MYARTLAAIKQGKSAREIFRSYQDRKRIENEKKGITMDDEAGGFSAGARRGNAAINAADLASLLLEEEDEGEGEYDEEEGEEENEDMNA